MQTRLVQIASRVEEQSRRASVRGDPRTGVLARKKQSAPLLGTNWRHACNSKLGLHWTVAKRRLRATGGRDPVEGAIIDGVVEPKTRCREELIS